MADDSYAPSRAFDALNPRELAAKRDYVRGLEQRRDPEALALLVECLCDESSFMRGLAEQAFVRIGEPVVPVLLPLLVQGLWFTRTSAAGILGRLSARAAVPVLARLADDRNRTVADGAGEALVAIGRSGGGFRIAHMLHRLPPDQRGRRMKELARRDGVLAGAVERLMASVELMTLEDDGTLADDSAVVRGAIDGVEWDVLTRSAPRRDPPPGTPGDGRAASA